MRSPPFFLAVLFSLITATHQALAVQDKPDSPKSSEPIANCIQYLDASDLQNWPLRPAVQVFVLTHAALASRLAEVSGIPFHKSSKQADLQATPADTMTLYFQKRPGDLTYANRWLPAGGVIDQYDLVGRENLSPAFANDSHKGHFRAPLDSIYEAAVRAYLAVDPKGMINKLDRFIRQHVNTASAERFAQYTQETALRELLEETGIEAKDLNFQIGVDDSSDGKMNYSFSQWAYILRGDPKKGLVSQLKSSALDIPIVASPKEAASEAYFTVAGAIEAELQEPGHFTPKTWEVICEMGLVQKKIGSDSLSDYQSASLARRYFRGLIREFNSGGKSFAELGEKFSKSGKRNSEEFLAFLEAELVAEAKQMRGIGPGGAGFSLVPIGEGETGEILRLLRDSFPRVGISTNLINPSEQTKRFHYEDQFPKIEIKGDEPYVDPIVKLGRKIEEYINANSPMPRERGKLRLYYSEIRRTYRGGPILPPTVFHYDMGKRLFLNVVVTVEGPLTVVDIYPPSENIDLALKGISHGPELSPPNHAHMTEPGFAVVNSTITRLTFYTENGVEKVGISYHSAPWYEGDRTLINYKFELVE